MSWSYDYVDCTGCLDTGTMVRNGLSRVPTRIPCTDCEKGKKLREAKEARGLYTGW